MRDLVERALSRLRDERDRTRPDRSDELVCLDALGGAQVLCPASAVRVVDVEAADGDQDHADADVAVGGDEWIVAHPDDTRDLQEVI